MHDRRGGWFYGWNLVALATFSLAVSNGLAVSGIAVFSAWIRDDLIARGAMRPETAQSVLARFGILTFLAAGAASFVAGVTLRRWSPKTLLLAGSVMLGASLLLHARAESTLPIYVARSLMGASLGFVGILVHTVLISQWFQRRRGVALGIMLTGTSLGGILVPLAATPLIRWIDWRFAMTALSLLVWCLLLPLQWLLIKNAPSDLGDLPDGGGQEPRADMLAADRLAASKVAAGKVAALGGSTRAEPSREEAMPSKATPSEATLLEILKSARFWVFTTTAALLFYPLFAVTQQFILHVRASPLGVSAEFSAAILSLLSAASIVGRLVFGVASDRARSTRVLVLCAALMLGSFACLAGMDATRALCFVALFGAGYGGALVMMQRLVKELFGAASHAQLLGIVTVFQTLGAAIGGWVTGAIADHHGGDYAVAFQVVALATGCGLATSIWLERASR